MKKPTLIIILLISAVFVISVPLFSDGILKPWRGGQPAEATEEINYDEMPPRQKEIHDKARRFLDQYENQHGAALPPSDENIDQVRSIAGAKNNDEANLISKMVRTNYELFNLVKRIENETNDLQNENSKLIKGISPPSNLAQP